MENNIINFNNNNSKPYHDDGECLILTTPERAYYSEMPLVNVPFNPTYAVKERIDRLKNMCDMAFWLSKTMDFGDHISFMCITPPDLMSRRHGAVYIDFENRDLYSVSEIQSPTGLQIFKDLCNGADQIELRRTSFNKASMIFYVNDVWITEYDEPNFKKNELVLPENVMSYWDSLKKNDFSNYKNSVAASKVINERIGYNEYINAVGIEMDEKNTSASGDISATRQKLNIVRDSLLSLVNDCGIGYKLYICNPNDEQIIDMHSFTYTVRISNYAKFDTDEKARLFKRCIDNASGFLFSLSDETGKLGFTIAVMKDF